MSSDRRRMLLSAAALIGAGAARGARPARAQPLQRDVFPEVRRGTALRFPRDHGAHPAFRTEWWYLTGWLRRLDGRHRGEPAGVQVTFFRSRTPHDPANPSRFAPTQLLFAHAALALPEHGRLLHEQRAARAGFGLAQASDGDTDVKLGPWSLRRDAEDAYVARIDAEVLSLDLVFRAAGAPLLQGEAGFSRKGPLESQASYYYSRPQLEVAGRITDGSATSAVDGVAWLDHEWSSEILDASASGWDWVGLNLDDGSALMAFRIRGKDGGVVWSDARRSGQATAQQPARVRFEPLRHWTSPRTGTAYPVQMRLTVDDRTFTLEPLFDDQELDTRGTTAVVYWEGAVRVIERATVVGRGYLELTGYGEALRM